MEGAAELEAKISGFVVDAGTARHGGRRSDQGARMKDCPKVDATKLGRRRPGAQGAALHLRAACHFMVVAGLLLFTGSGPAAAQTLPLLTVTTHHVDVGRTGWNRQETVLTPASIAATTFGPRVTVPLDEQVDAQPLYVAGQSIAGKGIRNVVYVATENNTVYAIDAVSGQVLLSRTLGPPVPMSVLPGQCDNNSTSIGITSTPVIDPASKTIYVITYTYESRTPVYRLHALDLSSLQEKMSTRYISAPGTLSGRQHLSL
jgi:hypothetical protein